MSTKAMNEKSHTLLVAAVVLSLLDHLDGVLDALVLKKTGCVEEEGRNWEFQLALQMLRRWCPTFRLWWTELPNGSFAQGKWVAKP